MRKLILALAAGLVMSGPDWAADPDKPITPTRSVVFIDSGGEPTDADKLKIREAQLARMSLVVQISQLEVQYRDLKAALDKATVAEKEAFAELAKRLNCTPDVQTLACAGKSGQ